LRRVDARARHELLQAVGEKVDGEHVVQRAAGLALSDGGAYCADDDCVPAYVSGHFASCDSTLSNALYTQLYHLGILRTTQGRGEFHDSSAGQARRPGCLVSG